MSEHVSAQKNIPLPGTKPGSRNSSEECYFASLSYTSIDLAESNPPRYWTKISVRLASCLNDRFSSLRILVVCEDTDHYSGVALYDYLEPSDNIRLSLSRQRRSASLVDPMPASVITVALKLTTHFNTGIVGLGLYQLSLLQTRDVKENAFTLKIIYDRILSINSVSIGACVQLQNTCPIPRGRYASSKKHRIHHVHNLFITPVISTMTRRGRDFPPEVLRRIVYMTLIGDLLREPDTWPETLLSLALVQKSWLGLRDLFWDLTFGKFPGYWVRNPAGVASSLEAQPHLGKTRLQCINCELMNAHQRELVTSMTRILAQAGRSLTYLFIDYPTFAASTTPLAALECVETFRLGVPPTWYDKTPRTALLKVQKVLKAWTMLRMFVFHAPPISDDYSEVETVRLGVPPTWYNKTSRTALLRVQKVLKAWTMLRMFVFHAPPMETTDFIAPYLLDHLELACLPIFEGRLLHFFTNPASQCLRTLRLVAVTGLSNPTLTTLLLLVAPTLEELQISKSIIKLPEKGMSYALDVALPNMVALRKAVVDCRIATVLSIQGLPPSNRSTRRSLTISVADLSRFFAPGPWLAESLKESKWTHISFGYLMKSFDMNQVPMWFKDRLKVARQVALDRGMSLVIYPISVSS